MTDKAPYCSLPGLFSAKFQAWFDSKFSDDCHLHDQQYGSLHPKTVTRAEADSIFRKAIAAKGYVTLSWTVWSFLRAFGWAWWQDYKPTV